MNLDRRQALAAMAGSATAASAALGTAGLALPRVAGAAARGAAFDPADPAQVALAFRKLGYSLDDRLTFWWMRGTRYGVVGSVATPFWDMYVAAWFTTRDLADGRWEVTMASVNLYTPVGGTTLLEKFDNPFTGRTVEVPYSRPRASKAVYDQKGGSAFAGGDVPGMKTTRMTDTGPAWVVGDTVHVQGDMMMDMRPVDPGRKGFTVNDWSTYIGSTADVLDPRKKNPPAAQVFNDILDYPPWLQMGDHPGTFVSRCYGRKVFDFASMPAVWQALFTKKFPDIARDTGALLRA